MSEALIEYIDDQWEIDLLKGTIFSEEELGHFLRMNGYDPKNNYIEISLTIKSK